MIAGPGSTVGSDPAIEPDPSSESHSLAEWDPAGGSFIKECIYGDMLSPKYPVF